MTAPSQLSLPGFTPPQDNQTETLKKIFVLMWSFIQKIVQQFNIAVALLNPLGSAITFKGALMTIVDGSSWHEIGAAGEPAFQNGWSGSNVRFRKDALGYVHLEGFVSGGTVGSAAFTLPTGYTPSASGFYAGVLAGGGAAWISISTTGTLNPSQATGDYLFGISFYAGP